MQRYHALTSTRTLDARRVRCASFATCMSRVPIHLSKSEGPGCVGADVAERRNPGGIPNLFLICRSASCSPECLGGQWCHMQKHSWTFHQTGSFRGLCTSLGVSRAYWIWQIYQLPAASNKRASWNLRHVPFFGRFLHSQPDLRAYVLAIVRIVPWKFTHHVMMLVDSGSIRAWWFEMWLDVPIQQGGIPIQVV